jgi:hypothetical protein
MKTGATATRLTTKLRHGRIVNAVADYFRGSLSVPNIFIKPRNFLGASIDVMAVDHAGSGDIFVAEIKLPAESAREAGAELSRKELRQYVQQIKGYPFHFKYLVLPADCRDIAEDPALFSSDGIGRVGILLAEESQEDLPRLSRPVRAERFRVGPEKLVPIEKFLAKAKPDMEVRI